MFTSEYIGNCIYVIKSQPSIFIKPSFLPHTFHQSIDHILFCEPLVCRNFRVTDEIYDRGDK